MIYPVNKITKVERGVVITKNTIQYKMNAYEGRTMNDAALDEPSLRA